MMRLRAVRALLVAEVAGLRVPRVDGVGEEVLAEQAARDREALDKARRKALLVIVLDAVALAVLFLLRDGTRVFLTLGRGEETAFTLGVLVVAVHLGFRLAQLQHLKTVDRLYDELLERDDEG